MAQDSYGQYGDWPDRERDDRRPRDGRRGYWEERAFDERRSASDRDRDYRRDRDRQVGGYGRAGAYGDDWTVGDWFERGADARRPDHRGRGPKGYRRSDERIREDVNDRLTDDPRLDASGLEVQVKDGEVTLGGEVETREDRRRAERLAEDCSGVKNVQNDIRVRPGPQPRPEARREGRPGNPAVRDVASGGTG